MFPFTKYSKLYYLFSGILIAGAIASLIVFGLKFGIEFTGGSNMEVQFTGARPANEAIQKQLASFNLGDITVQPTGDNGAVLKFRGVDEATQQQILTKLNQVSHAQ